jgi:L-asparagine oxygenase
LGDGVAIPRRDPAWTIFTLADGVSPAEVARRPAATNRTKMGGAFRGSRTSRSRRCTSKRRPPRFPPVVATHLVKLACELAVDVDLRRVDRGVPRPFELGAVASLTPALRLRAERLPLWTTAAMIPSWIGTDQAQFRGEVAISLGSNLGIAVARTLEGARLGHRALASAPWTSPWISMESPPWNGARMRPWMALLASVAGSMQAETDASAVRCGGGPPLRTEDRRCPPSSMSRCGLHYAQTCWPASRAACAAPSMAWPWPACFTYAHRYNHSPAEMLPCSLAIGCLLFYDAVGERGRLPLSEITDVETRRKHICDAIEQNGYAFLERHLIGRSTAEVACEIGLPIALGGGNAVHALMPRQKHEVSDTTYSDEYGLGTFPLHTDLAHWYAPPRYFLLRCVLGFDAVATLVVDGMRAVRRVGPEILFRALMQPRRSLMGRRSLLRLYDPGIARVRWDERYIVPASTAGLRGSTSLKEVLAGEDPVRLSLALPGDTLIIDNWRIVHGRAPVPESCRARVVERVYLQRIY